VLMAKAKECRRLINASSSWANRYSHSGIRQKVDIVLHYVPIYRDVFFQYRFLN
jgi:hypothetical protein